MSAKKTPVISPEERRRLAEVGPRTWQRMLSGRRLNLVDPSPLDIEIEDVALALSRNVRWNGQTIGDHGWSVAQHSVLVVDIVRRLDPKAKATVLMGALLHDAPEFVTHDLITPLKAVVGDVFRVVEDRLQEAVNRRFRLPPRFPPATKALIKRADLVAGATEAVQLAGFTEDEVAAVLGITEKPLPDVTLTPLPSKKAEEVFLNRFEELEKRVRLQLGK